MVSGGKSPPVQVGLDEVTLFHDAAHALENMLEAIGRAEREILLEMYWFDSTAIGLRFADLLMEKAKRGVRVAVIYDAFGSLGADSAMFRRLAAAGCSVEVFNPLMAVLGRVRFAELNRRDHRKILVVDETIAFTGGVNIGGPWYRRPGDREGVFRDDMVRVEGPAANLLREVFFDGWRRVRGARGRLKVTELDRLALAASRRSRRQQAGVSWAPPSMQGASSEGPAISVLGQRGFSKSRAIRQAYLQRIRRARKEVFLTNSYFVPDNAVQRTLIAAAERGVDVRVLVPAKSDVPIVAYASQRQYQGLLDAGVRIYEWLPSVLHAKTAVIDSEWSTVGTYNLDHRSWRFNLEVNLLFRSVDVAAELRKTFLEDLSRSREVDPRVWANRSLLKRLLEELCFALRPLL